MRPKLCHWAQTAEGQAILTQCIKSRTYRPRTLTDDQIRGIRQAVLDGVSQKKTAKQFGISQGAVNQIINGKTYKDVGA